MSSPREADDVKLISSLFSPRKDQIEEMIHELEGSFGLTDWMSPELLFDRTRYYEREMGWPLYRRFVSFRELIGPGNIVDIKLATNGLENRYRQDERRTVNIDPGYVSLERLVLVTGKNYVHRIYLSKGVYAELTLVFKKGGFTPLQWTYRDYADPVVIRYFNEIRERYKRELRGRIN